MPDPHPDDDLLLALALDDVDDPGREATLEHLATCRRCRNGYDALSGTVEHSLAAAPNVEPSIGFDARALTAMGWHDSPSRRPPRRRQRWRLVAASVVVGLGLGAGGTVALTQVNDPAGVPPGPQSAPLQTNDGERVGTVTKSFIDGEPVLVVTVTGGRVGMEYQCLLGLEGGERIPTATWVLESARGATWVLDSPDTPVTEVALVANGGKGPVWSTARL